MVGRLTFTTVRSRMIKPYAMPSVISSPACPRTTVAVAGGMRAARLWSDSLWPRAFSGSFSTAMATRYQYRILISMMLAELLGQRNAVLVVLEDETRAR